MAAQEHRWSPLLTCKLGAHPAIRNLYTPVQVWLLHCRQRTMVVNLVNVVGLGSALGSAHPCTGHAQGRLCPALRAAVPDAYQDARARDLGVLILDEQPYRAVDLEWFTSCKTPKTPTLAQRRLPRRSGRLWNQGWRQTPRGHSLWRMWASGSAVACLPLLGGLNFIQQFSPLLLRLERRL